MKIISKSAIIGIAATVLMGTMAIADPAATPATAKKTSIFDLAKAKNAKPATPAAHPAAAPAAKPAAKPSIFSSILSAKPAATKHATAAKPIALPGTRSGNKVTTTTSTGKTITYDCSKMGNKNKKACS